MQLIDNSHDLQNLCNRLAKEQFITVDLEFIREKTYYPILCLIQVASETEAAIIDPIAEGIELSSFFALMQNEKVLKVFHSCRQDVEIIYELSGNIPMPIFDSQVAAMVCGFGESISYDRLVKAIVGIELDKSNRLSNWQNRPLEKEQLEYAIADVTHLTKIYNHLFEVMKTKNRMSWLDEEMSIITKKETYFTKPEEAWHKIRFRSHNAKVLSNLRALAAWREKRAITKNVPRQNIIKDDFLVMIATASPKNYKDMEQIRGMRKDVASGKLADEMLETLDKVKVDPKIVNENKIDLPNFIPSLVELLKMLLKIIALREGVVPRIICSELDLQKFAAHQDKNNPILKGWRYHIFGQEAMKLREGSLSIRYNSENNDIELLESPIVATTNPKNS